MDIVAGACAGVAQVAVGHPFDTLKVRLQNKLPLSYRCLDLYRGGGYPLAFAVLYNSAVFPIVQRSPYNSVCSGFLAGLVVTPLVFVFDVCKVKRQTKDNKTRGFFFLLKQRGFTMAMCRESLAMAMYFSSYHKLKERIPPLYAGGIAGLLNWTCTYPIDVIRNRQFSQNCTIRDAFSQKRFWRGYTFCAARAVIVNTAIFATYEYFSVF